MRADVRRRPSDELGSLLYLFAHVLACGLGYLLGNYFLGEGRISLWFLVMLYVVLFFANPFVGFGLEYVFKRFRIRLNIFLLVFLSHLVLFASFLFLYFWLRMSTF